ncbi:ADP-ribose pyrophosphatase [Minicystis rosea]|nr:ADP-ribose pyrophosphatase [Minicystis rosea]
MSEGKTEYPRPSLTADVVVVALEAPADRRAWLKVLFIQRARDPFAGRWALPGGFVEPTETVAEAAARELCEETSLDRVRVEELGCFSKPGRDPRGWVVTVAHLAPVPADRLADARAGDDAAATAWLDLRIGPLGEGFTLSRGDAPVTELAFDHFDIVTAAVARLVQRVDELAFALLPEAFTIADAARAYEAILGVGIDEQMIGERLTSEHVVREVGPGRYAFAGVTRRWPFRPGPGE